MRTLTLLVTSALTAPAFAQSAEPTIELRARVHMDRLEVQQAGEARVELRAEPGTTVNNSSRGTLPRPLAPGVYRNVDVTLDLAATIDQDGTTVSTDADASAEPDQPAPEQPQ